MPAPKDKIERARELLQTVRHAAMATVNADGSPHNTPYFFAHDAQLEHIYWASHQGAQHSQNVERTGQGFVVLYDAFQGGGLYMRVGSVHTAEGDELKTAYAVFSRRAEQVGKHIAGVEHYQGDGPERLYIATVEQLWVNDAERGPDGFILRDHRFEITRDDPTGVN